jgi:hypothetical protein
MHSRTKDGVERTWYPQESRFFEHGSRDRERKLGPRQKARPWKGGKTPQGIPCRGRQMIRYRPMACVTDFGMNISMMPMTLS